MESKARFFMWLSWHQPWVRFSENLCSRKCGGFRLLNAWVRQNLGFLAVIDRKFTLVSNFSWAPQFRFRNYTIEVIVTSVSWFITYLWDLQPTYIWVRIHLHPFTKYHDIPVGHGQNKGSTWTAGLFLKVGSWHEHWKNTWLVRLGDDLLPSYIGIIISHYKDRY